VGQAREAEQKFFASFFQKRRFFFLLPAQKKAGQMPGLFQ
jgi:hypothetical protein